MSRNYKSEYKNYHSSPKQIARRSARNKARRAMTKKVGAGALKGQDVDHKDRNPANNSYANLRIQTKRRNRSRNS